MAVNHQRWRGNLRQRGAAVAVCEDGRKLPRRPLRTVCASHRSAREAGDAHLFGGVMRAAKRVPLVNGARNGRLQGFVRQGGQKRPFRVLRAARQLRIAGRGHHRRQAVDPLRVRDGHALRNHAAHRQPDHMRSSLPEVIEQIDGVLRHLRERVGGGERCRRVAPSQQGFQRRRRRRRAVRAAGVAVVEDDRAVARRHDAFEQRFRPLHELTPEAVDEQHARIGPRAPKLEVDRAAARVEFGHRERESCERLSNRRGKS